MRILDKFETKTTLRNIIYSNGKLNQLMIAVEELAELQKEISKAYRNLKADGAVRTNGLITEIADCLICIKQIQIMFGIPDDYIEEEIQRKLERTKERMKDGRV